MEYMRITKEIKIGLAGVVALALLVIGINYFKGVNLFQSTASYYIKFTDINGLAKSSPIFADGYRVGVVSDINYDYANAGNVVVRIDVDPSLRIPKGSTAELTSDFLGAVRMSLLLANNPREKQIPGDTINGSVNAGLMGKAANMVPQLEQMLPKLDSILIALNTLLNNPTIPATLQNVESLTASLNANSRQLESLMKNEVPQLTSKLNEIGDNFAVISANLKEIDYATTMNKVDATLANVKSITDKLEQNDNTVGLLLNDPTLYNNLTETTANAANLLEDLQRHPKRYVHFSIFGKKDKTNELK
ncbi:MAG: MCE family protein [Bacteroidaceae bacterium]|nr:MCE family protein [Bacteroidaceae bacterium]